MPERLCRTTMMAAAIPFLIGPDLTAAPPFLMSSSSSSNWKHPSAQQKQKYGLVDLPDDFEPTDQEQMLLDMYRTVQAYERHAAKLKEEAARAKLAAAEEEFHRKIKPKKNPRAPTERVADANGKEPDAGPDDQTTDDLVRQGVAEEYDEVSRRERREARLEALRQEVEEAKQQKQSEEEILRQQLLQEQEPVLEGPVLKRKRLNVDEEQPSKSLISNITSTVTPPHDFSKTLNLSYTQGRILFPTGSEAQTVWTPQPTGSPNVGALKFRLTGFDISKAQNGQGDNTLAIKFMVPSDSKRFSLNITTPKYENTMETVLFHFNPRQFEKGGHIILNDKQEGTWGQQIALPLSQVPLIFGQASCTLVIQITGDGFDVFLRERDAAGSADGLLHVARWQHKEEPTEELVLQFPSTDDYGSVENWSVFKVWWGNQPIRAREDAAIAGMNALRLFHPRKLFVSQLAKVFTDADVDVRRAELERAFRKYGGDLGVSVIVPKNSTFAFVEVESERDADLALSEMSSHYQLKRARWSRHEALKEERAAKEASKQSNKAEGWD